MTHAVSTAKRAFQWSRLPLLMLIALLAFYPIFARFYVSAFTAKLDAALNEMTAQTLSAMSLLDHSYRPVTVTLTNGTTVTGQVTGERLLCFNESDLIGDQSMTVVLPDGSRWTGRDVRRVQEGNVVYPRRITAQERADAVRVGLYLRHCTEQIQLARL